MLIHFFILINIPKYWPSIFVCWLKLFSFFTIKMSVEHLGLGLRLGCYQTLAAQLGGWARRLVVVCNVVVGYGGDVWEWP